ncbi:hypothetical protein BDN70DRAFT_898387 [Pholiota conissans]|uniref:Uncharacterized protein n=1 Tax=Pholiota conissans TaxID=109636 RepID=A0A9P5YU46_9AGAR|nr:hypothetical protein BDN70DRAFT_898387 [Pholiota conissans]
MYYSLVLDQIRLTTNIERRLSHKAYHLMQREGRHKFFNESMLDRTDYGFAVRTMIFNTTVRRNLIILSLLLWDVATAATIDIASAKIVNSQDFATHPSSINDTIGIHIDPAPDGFNDSRLYFASVTGMSLPVFIQNFFQENGTDDAPNALFDIPKCPSGTTNIVILVSPQILISNPGVRTTTTNTNFVGATTVTSTPTETVEDRTTFIAGLSSSNNAPTKPATPSVIITPKGLRHETPAIAISLTLGGTLILILLAGTVRRRRRKSSILAAAQPFDSIPSASDNISSWPPLLRLPAEKLESKFPSISPPQEPTLPPPVLVQEHVQPSQNLDVIAQLQEHIRYLEEVRDLDIGLGDQVHLSRGVGATVDDPPPEYPDAASGVSVSR